MAMTAAQAGDDAKIAFAKKPESTGNVSVTRPMTGQEFLDSLNDDREVYIYGERVKKVLDHPAFRNTARMVARFYGALSAMHTEPFCVRRGLTVVELIANGSPSTSESLFSTRIVTGVPFGVVTRSS